ncbi:glycogen synthase [Patescibacteria group bacterium]|nr:glycogen synthase [Patescibacteria group bacterium]
MDRQLKILFVASELTPLAKVGGLADVIGSLPQALTSLGVDARVVIPKYGIIDEKKYSLKLLAQKLNTTFAEKKEEFNIYQTYLTSSSLRAAQKTPLYLIDHQKYLGQGGVYPSPDASSEGSAEEAYRFTFFTKTVLEIFKDINWLPDIIHCHDWHVAMLPLLAKQSKEYLPTLLTIHNLAYQGDYPADLIIKILGQQIINCPSIRQRLKKSDTINYLEQGILNADLINTVSPTYASEILTPEFGCGLENVLAKRRPYLFGILNGIDTSRFNPETDPEINHNYLATNLQGKVKNKKDLQNECGLKIEENVPIISMISRLTEQKGLNILLPALKKLIKEKAQFVFLGTGSLTYEKKLEHFAKHKNIFVKIGFDAALAQRIYAGSDMFLMPSRFEPCGLGQLISLRYGTIPIARAIGGLKDTITELGPNNGSGFLFYPYEAKALIKTVKRAIKVFADQKGWQQAQKRVMQLDFSWIKSAKKYLELYQRLT